MKKKSETQKIVMADDIIDSLYELVLSGGDWKIPLGKIAEFTGASFAKFMLIDQVRNVPTMIDSNDFGAELTAAYNQDFAAMDPTLAIVNRLDTGQWYYDKQMLPKDILEKSVFYNELMAKHKLGGMLGTAIIRNEELYTGISLLRPADSPYYSDTEIASMQYLFPHIKRSMQLYFRYTELRQQADIGLSALEKLTLPVWVVDSKGLIKMSNSAAESVIRAKHGLSVRNNMLSADGQSSVDFKQRLHQSAGCLGVPVAGGLRVHGNSQALGLHLALIPLPVRSQFNRLWQEPLVMVIAHDLASETKVSTELMCQLFSLTPAETRLVNLLINGLSPSDCSELLGVTIATIRTQIRSIYAKTGVNSVSKLVRMLSFSF